MSGGKEVPEEEIFNCIAYYVGKGSDTDYRPADPELPALIDQDDNFGFDRIYGKWGGRWNGGYWRKNNEGILVFPNYKKDHK